MSKNSLSNSENLLEFQNIIKRFPSKNKSSEYFTAVDNLSLSIKEGELVTLLGPSGCGKTTTLRILAGFERQTEGKVIVGSKDLSNEPPNKRDIGMVFQNYALFPHLSVYENVAYGLKIAKYSTEEVKRRTKEVLSLMDIAELKDRNPSEISGGQQQRVAIARAIVVEPKILLFDEPLSNLDSKLRQQMRTEIRNLQQRLGITSIYVTHDQEEAMAISDKIAILNEGKIQQVGSPIDIYLNPANHFVANFIGDSDILSCKVEEVKRNKLLLSINDIKFVVENDVSDVKTADEVDCVIKPEFWHIDESGDFQVEITQATLLGSHMEYEAKIGCQTFKFFDFNYYKNGMLEAGEFINLVLRTNLVKVLKRSQT